VTGVGLADQIANYRIHFGAEMPAEKAHEVIEQWRATAQEKAGGRWPRQSVRVTTVEPGRLTFNVTIEIAEGAETKTIPCRTPRLSVNPAAGVMVVELGGQLPSGPPL
jgi:hypothetical protein